jgi:hypothetical protein
MKCAVDASATVGLKWQGQRLSFGGECVLRFDESLSMGRMHLTAQEKYPDYDRFKSCRPGLIGRKALWLERQRDFSV